MNSNVQKQYKSKLETFSEVSSIFIIIASILFLAGWAFDITILKTPGSNFPTVKSNTALSFLLVGISIWLLQERRINQRNIKIARVLALIVLFIGSLTLFEYISGVSIGIDQILFSEPGGAIQTVASNRMSIVAALSFLLIGISLLMLDMEKNRDFQLFQLFIILVGLISFLIVLGYLYQTTIYPIRNTTAPSPYGSLILILITLTILASRPCRGFMELLTSERVSAAFGRRVLPIIVIVPLILGWIRLLGENYGLYDAAFGTAIAIFFTILIMLILIWSSILSIDKIDLKRMIAENDIKRQAKLLNLTRDAIFVRNLDNKITFWNKGSEETYGYAENEVLGKVIYELLQAEYPKQLNEIQTDVLKYGQWNGELRHKKRDGTSIVVLSRWSLEKDEKGNPTGFLEINTDITERKKAEEKLKKLVEDLKRSNYELQQFTFITSHDLQEPLRSIASFSQLLEMRYKNKLDDDADEYIKFVVDAAMRMKEMIQGLLDYSNIGTQKERCKPLKVEDILKQALYGLTELIEENNAEITYDPLPIINADKEQMIQLFNNLIENAIKFRKKDIPPKIHISCQEDTQKNEYIFSIADNGIGLEPQYSNKIFEIFKRLHTIDEYRGTGIGLAISKRIVERHGGHIWVESILGNGATFYFTIKVKLLEKNFQIS